MVVSPPCRVPPPALVGSARPEQNRLSSRQGSEEKPTFREQLQESNATTLFQEQGLLTLNREQHLVTKSSVQDDDDCDDYDDLLHQDEKRDTGGNTAEQDDISPKISESSSDCNWRERLQRKLLQRTAELDQVVACYENKLANPETTAFLLVTGPLGVGKTRLVTDALYQRVRDQGGYFLRGKQDLLGRPVPYSGLVSAFDDFTHQVIQRGPEAVEATRSAICTAVDEDCSVLVRMFPSLKQIIGDRNESTSSPKSERALQKFVFVFFTFMKAISSLEQPLVLFLDDIHWTDPCSVDLISLFVAKQISGLFIIGAFDDEYRDSYFAQKLHEVNVDCCGFTTIIRIGKLDQGEVNHLVGNALQLSSLHLAEDLGTIINQQSKGSLFLVVEFMQWMQDNALLVFDDKAMCWRWNGAEIQRRLDVCRNGSFLNEKIEQLPTEMRDILKVAACFGFQLNPTLIEYVLDLPVAAVLIEAASMHILSLDESTGIWSFEHDGIQQAVYNLIQEGNRELFHLEVGRRLWRRLNSEELEQNLFAVLSQMNIGKRLMTREKERYSVASLCLHAGTKAAKLSTFRTASVYLNLGIELLGEPGWNDVYDLALATYNAAAEMNMCTGSYGAMESLLESVLKHSRSSEDRIQAHATKIYAMGMNDRQDEALDLGITVLVSLGEKFTLTMPKAAIKSEIRSVMKMMKGRSNEQLMSLPNIEDEEVLARLQILSMMYMNAILIRRQLTPCITIKLMKLTLIHGLSLIASSAFSTFGILCMTANRDAETALRFGELALQLTHRLKVKVYVPRIYAGFYGCIHHWKRPLRDTLDPLLLAHRIGLLTGDVEYASLNANLYCYNAFDSGVPLDEIERMWGSFRRTMDAHKQIALHRMSVPCMYAIQYYLNHTDDTGETDRLIKENESLNRHGSADNVRLYQMKTAYLFNDYELADRLSSQAADSILTMPPTCEIVSMSFTRGMIALAMALKGKHVRRNIRIARQVIATLTCMSRSCPANCLDKKLLLEAELAALRGNKAKAVELYSCSIAVAHTNRFVHIQALANERCARYFLSDHNANDAIVYYRQAITLYEVWGAKRKVDQLLEEGATLFGDELLSSSPLSLPRHSPVESPNQASGHS